MEQIQDKPFIHNVCWIMLTIALITVLLGQVDGSGGSGCLTKEAKPYSCTCPGTGIVEHYFGNEDLKEAMSNPHTCCYKAAHYVRPEIMLNPKIGDWVQNNNTWYKLVGISAKSYRGPNSTNEVITTKTVLVPYNETNEYIEWMKMYPPEEPILYGPCEDILDNETATTATPATVDLTFARVSIYDLVRTINWILL